MVSQYIGRKKKLFLKNGKIINLTATDFILFFLMKSIDSHMFRSQGTYIVEVEQ